MSFGFFAQRELIQGWRLRILEHEMFVGRGRGLLDPTSAIITWFRPADSGWSCSCHGGRFRTLRTPARYAIRDVDVGRIEARSSLPVIELTGVPAFVDRVVGNVRVRVDDARRDECQVVSMIYRAARDREFARLRRS